jgi:hypothetical protein
MKHTLKSTLVYIAVMVAALILCLDDIEGWPASSKDLADLQDWQFTGCEECNSHFDLMSVELTQNGYIVAKIVMEPIGGGDYEMVEIAWCLQKLMDAIPDTYGKEIQVINPDAEQIMPFGWTWLSPCRVEALNAPWDEFGIADSIDEYLELCLTGRT